MLERDELGLAVIKPPPRPPRMARRTRPAAISFQGRHNRRKAEILGFFASHGFVTGSPWGLTAAQVAEMSSWSLKDLRPFFTRWARWGYLARTRIDPHKNAGSLFRYRLTEKGLRFVRLARANARPQ